MNRGSGNNVILGIGLVALGLMLLGAQFGVFHFSLFSGFVENYLWLVALGAFLFFRPRPKKTLGISLCFMGLLLYASTMGYIQYLSWSHVWPLLLVGAGFRIVLKNRQMTLRA